MIARRPLAVKLIAAYLGLKAVVLTLCAAGAHLWPSKHAAANGVIEDLVPMIAELRDARLDLWLAPLFALTDMVLGLGVWFLQNWARIIIIIDLSWLFGRAAAGLLLLPAFAQAYKLHPRAPSPWVAVNLVAGLVTLGCLLDPDLRRAFGGRA
jgi:hypothetical protein